MSDSLFTSKSLNTPVDQILAPEITSILTTDTAVSELIGDYEYILTSFNGGESLTGNTPFYITATGSSIEVYFNEVSGATDYKLYRSVNGDGNFVFCNKSTSSPITDENIYSGGLPPLINTTNYKSRGLGSQYSKYSEVIGDKKILLKEILLNNISEDVKNVTINLPNSGEEVSFGNTILNMTLSANETKFISLNTILEEGDSIYGKVDDIGSTQGFSEVNLKLSGIIIEQG